MTDPIKNGIMNKVLAAVLAGLLLMAAGGTYNASSRLATMEAQLVSIMDAMKRIDGRLTYLERKDDGR